uniref:B-box type zinc finger protein ncl-1 n=1 Tax=Panagrellus redivivus TaxID=6233 RepID=A0A7E4V2B1_PANRE
MDSATSLLWNFDDKMGEQDLDYYSNNTVTNDDISLIFSSMARQVPQSISITNANSMTTGSFGLAPTPPPIAQAMTETRCPICMHEFTNPKVLACFHSFCKHCLELNQSREDRVTCPVCNGETLLTPQLGIDGLLNDYGLQNICDRRSQANANLSDEDSPPKPIGTPTEDKGLIFGSPSSTGSSPPRTTSPPTDLAPSNTNNNEPSCVNCKQGDQVSANCTTCGHLCNMCKVAHEYMHCFESHVVEMIPERATSSKSNTGLPKQTNCRCLEHRSQPLRFFCKTCNLAICYDCTLTDHIQPAHEIEPIESIADSQIQRMEHLVNEAAKKQQEVHESFRIIDSTQSRLHMSHQHALSLINESCNMVVNMAQEMRQIMIKDLESKFGLKQLALAGMDKEVQRVAKKMSQMIEFTRRLLNYSSPTEIMVFKPLIDTRIESFLKFNVDIESLNKLFSGLDVHLLQAEQVRTGLAEILSRTGVDSHVIGQAPLTNGLGSGDSSSPLSSSLPHATSISRSMDRSSSRTNLGSPTITNGVGNYDIKPYHNGINGLNGLNGNSSCLLGTSAPAGGMSNDTGVVNFDKVWGHIDDSLNSLVVSNDMDQLSQSLPFQLYPPRSQIKRQKMIYYCKFGEFGVIEGQFTEPSGVAVNNQNDIIVADTNNHRIQVFDKEGRFKFQFGECGKRDGQLLYPNRVSVNRVTGDFIVTERSPTHQIQVFNQYGQFMRKFGANILQHPRGVCVDHQGRIIVVECKVMRVIIFDAFGNVLQKFSCSRYLEFPNGVCATPNNEILISDNRAHCIKVFNYEGQYLRQIGGEGITNYPIGVGINSLGEVIVADNHNNFNLTIFDQKGNMLNALESKVKHAQCFDMALVDDGSVVLASKDYRLYLYRYAQPLPIC